MSVQCGGYNHVVKILLAVLQKSSKHEKNEHFPGHTQIIAQKTFKLTPIGRGVQAKAVIVKESVT